MAFHHDIDPKPSNKFTKEEIPAQCQKLIMGSGSGSSVVKPLDY